MKAVILTGGYGTRIIEYSMRLPKPMVEIGARPILWHIMKYYGHFGIRDFIICLGYKGYIIKEYFANYFMHNNDLILDLEEGSIEYFNSQAEPWRITLVDTGDGTMTGGRIKRIRPYLHDDSTFFLTYGDGLTDVDLGAELNFHKQHGGKATVLGVRPSGRFGALDLEGSRVRRFIEKPKGDGGYISGGYFVLSTEVIDLIEGDDTVWEQEPLQGLGRMGELHAFCYNGFWACMDTLKDANQLNELWETKNAPWKVW